MAALAVGRIGLSIASSEGGWRVTDGGQPARECPRRATGAVDELRQPSRTLRATTGVGRPTVALTSDDAYLGSDLQHRERPRHTPMMTPGRSKRDFHPLLRRPALGRSEGAEALPRRRADDVIAGRRLRDG